jgi:predicted polyphosphate/ATP-dependent NAD kinase
MRRIGVVVNPIAGMGGRVGLKGTDGQVDAARERGATPRAADAARRALDALYEAAPETRIVTADGVMGTDAATDAGFDSTVLDVPETPEDPYGTTAADTRAAVAAFVDRAVDLVLFVGGDGTAADVADALDATGALDGDGAGDRVTPMLGVPAGVKIYSAVFATTPERAGHTAATFEDWEEREVVDIDEAAVRAGALTTSLHAVVPVPVAQAVQARKGRPGGSIDGLAAGVASEIGAGETVVFGPGGTVATIERALGVEPTLLGVDVYRDGALVARDATEAEILDAIDAETLEEIEDRSAEDAGGRDRPRIVVSPIGGQGVVFGRGNQQLSPAVIRRCAITIVASRAKLDEIGVLHVDTGDPALDEELRGWWRVRTGRHERRLVELV